MFKTPKTYYDNYYDRARFKLTWKVCVATCLSMVFFAITMGLLTPSFMAPSLIALGVSALLVWHLYKSKKYKLAAKLFVIMGTTLSIGELFLVTNILHLIDFIWFFVIILFAYFTLGKKWGFVVLGVLILAISLFVQFSLNKNLINVQTLDLAETTSMIINALFAGAILAYIITQFINTNNHAEEKYNLSNLKLKEQNEVIKNKNEEKEVMLKEIHHRVKNNLQVITSLLRLHSKDLQNKEAKEHYEDAINRIATMSLIHEKMYQNDLIKIDLNNYFRSLSEDLKSSYSSKELSIQFQINLDIEEIGLKTIVPLALLYNELVSNSLKHAFKNSTSGIITLKGKQLDEDTFHIEYTDNGAWSESDKEESFGLELVQTFTDQLDGSFERATDKGTQYKFKFKSID